MSSDVMQDLTTCGEALRVLFADERKAISTLDHVRLEQIAQQKGELAMRLDRLRKLVSTTDPQVRDLFELIRTEARATALLATAATQAVRDLLGYKPANAYDRMARHNTASPGRVLARY